MKKLNVAILEDDIDLLKDLYLDLKTISSIEVLVKETSSQKFLDEVKEKSIDFLILDIDLQNDSKSGIDVANKLKLPVLFITGKTNDYVERIQSFNSDHPFPVHSLTKPVPVDRLKKIIEKISLQIHQNDKSNFIYLDFKGSKLNKVEIETIVYLCTDKNHGSESNNKLIYFTNRKPEILVDFSFSKMLEKGLDPELLIQSHKQFWVNKKKVNCYNKDHTIEVDVTIDENGNKTTKQIPVSENYRPNFKNFKSK